MRLKLIVITSRITTRLKYFINSSVSDDFEVIFIDNQQDLISVSEKLTYEDIIISFLSGVIIPSTTLKKVEIAINFHPASPDYPGRDTHHFAIYNKEKIFGATAHIMNSKVDSGRILATEKFLIPESCTPTELSGLAAEYAYILLRQLFPKIMSRSVGNLTSTENWGVFKYTRKYFAEMCRIEQGMDEEEVNRRIFAFDVKGYSNIYTSIYGKKFYYVNNND